MARGSAGAGGVEGAVPLRRRRRAPRSPTRRSSSASARSRSRPRGRTSGSRRARARSCRRRASTRRGGSSTSTTRDYRARQEQAKYDKLIRFAERLPRAARGDGRAHGARRPAARRRSPRSRSRLINLGWFRVGGDRYAKTSRTFGITTLRKSHVTVRGSRISFRYRGKHSDHDSQRDRRRRARRGDARAARAARARGSSSSRPRRRALQPRPAAAERLHPGRTSATEFSAKDFRTWGGTLIAAIELAEQEPPESATRGEDADRGGDAQGRREARQYARRRALLVRQPGGRRAVSRRAERSTISGPAICASSAPAIPVSIREEQATLSLLRSWRIRACARRCVNCTGNRSGGEIGTENHSRLRQLRQRSRRGARARRSASPTSTPAAARRSPISATTAPARCRAAPPPAAAAGRRPQAPPNELE